MVPSSGLDGKLEDPVLCKYPSGWQHFKAVFAIIWLIMFFSPFFCDVPWHWSRRVVMLSYLKLSTYRSLIFPVFTGRSLSISHYLCRNEILCPFLRAALVCGHKHKYVEGSLICPFRETKMCSALTYSLPYHMLLSGFILSGMCYIPSVRMAILEITDSCEVVWKGELIFSVGRSVGWYRHCGILYGGLS